MARELKETKSDDESCGPNHLVKEIKEAKPKDRHSGIFFVRELKERMRLKLWTKEKKASDHPVLAAGDAVEWLVALNLNFFPPF